MKAALVREYGSPRSVITVSTSHPKPKLPDEPSKSKVDTKSKGHLLVRVQACSLSPGDVRTITGEKSFLTKTRHQYGFPYIPGGDICGTVVETAGDAGTFKTGDSIIATWDMFGEGGMADYAAVPVKFAVHKPASLSAVEGAALANSAGHALKVVRQAGISTGHRVLILGGSGGVGTSAIQFARQAGAAYIAAASTDAALLQSLGVDRVIDHTTTDWWTVPEFESEPFDVIIDCAVGVSAWEHAKQSKVLKKRGLFIAVVYTTWEINIRSWLGVVTFLMKPALRKVMAKLPFGSPKYDFYLSSVDGAVNTEVMKAVECGALRAVVDSKSPLPLPFTAEGVIAAFEQQEQRKGHGKVVVEIAK